MLMIIKRPCPSFPLCRILMSPRQRLVRRGARCISYPSIVGTSDRCSYCFRALRAFFIDRLSAQSRIYLRHWYSWAHFLSVVNNITPMCLFASWFSRCLLLGISDFKNSKRSVLINKRWGRQSEKINLWQPSHWLSIFKRIAENQSPQLFSHLAWTMKFFV